MIPTQSIFSHLPLLLGASEEIPKGSSLPVQSIVSDLPTAFMVGGFIVALVFYLFMIWDSRRDDDGDDQIIFKIVLGALMLAGFMTFVAGLKTFVHFILAIFSVRNWHWMRTGLANIITGGVVTGAIYWFILRKTNWQEYPRVARTTVGIATITTGAIFIVSLSEFFIQLLWMESWMAITGSLTSFIVFGAVAAASLWYFGKQCGVEFFDPESLKRLRGGGGDQEASPAETLVDMTPPAVDETPPQEGGPPPAQ